MEDYNETDQWSEIIPVLRSTEYMMRLALYYLRWALEEGLSADGLIDAVIIELYIKNKADLFDYNGIYLDFEKLSVEDELPDDTRHFMQRLLKKATRRPKQRLHLRLVRLVMFLDLAMKCRKARMSEA